MSFQLLEMAGGNCKLINIIYFAQYTKCSKLYFGKTINSLGGRISGYRSHIKDIENVIEFDDRNSLAAHAYFCHNVNSTADFNNLYHFSIVKHVDPKNLLMNEQFYINKYKSYAPFGLNIQNPIGISAMLVT